jgi:hypothetical protein
MAYGTNMLEMALEVSLYEQRELFCDCVFQTIPVNGNLKKLFRILM